MPDTAILKNVDVLVFVGVEEDVDEDVDVDVEVDVMPVGDQFMI